ncbi:hypothetical protein cypCar_00042276 [Cyprinus carpio]|nr:hypothetical protein cypCar_00042276 [Cyprinus carpio]
MYRPSYVTPQQYQVAGSPGFYPGTSPADYAGAYYPAQAQFTPPVAPAPVIINPAPQQPQAPPPQPQQAPPRRERKQIRIRDPNQGGRDITEEIMSGGRSGSTPTPPQPNGDNATPAVAMTTRVEFPIPPGESPIPDAPLTPPPTSPISDTVDAPPPAPADDTHAMPTVMEPPASNGAEATPTTSKEEGPVTVTLPIAATQAEPSLESPIVQPEELQMLNGVPAGSAHRDVSPIAEPDVAREALPVAANIPDRTVKEIPPQVVKETPAAIVKEEPAPVVKEPTPPVVKETPAPIVKETAASVVKETLTPVVKETPAPVVKETPAPVVKETPAPVVKETPAPVVKETPDPVVKETPAPVVKETPAPVVKETPAPVVKETPAPVIKETPVPVVKETAAPVVKETSTPVVKEMAAPVVKETPAPVVKETAAPFVKETPAPVVKATVPVVAKETPTPVDVKTLPQVTQEAVVKERPVVKETPVETTPVVEETPSLAAKETPEPLFKEAAAPSEVVSKATPPPMEAREDTPTTQTTPSESSTQVVSVPKKKRKMKDLNKKEAGDLLDAFKEPTPPEPEATPPVKAEPESTAPVAPPPAEDVDETWEEKEDKLDAENIKPQSPTLSLPTEQKYQYKEDKLDAENIKPQSPEPSSPTEQKYQYKAEQWKPLNPEEKKKYDREFLLGFQFISASMNKPEGLPQISDVVLDKANKTPLRQLDPSRLPGMNCGPDFTPSFANLGRPSAGGRGPPSGLSGPRRSGQGQRGKEPRKIIASVSLTEDVQLNKAEKAWKPTVKRSGRADEDEPDFLKTQELFKRVRSVLNKLTPQMFQPLMKQVTELTIDTEERLKGVIDLIFEKAISEPNFSVAYANMCRCLMGEEEKQRLKEELEDAKDKARRRSLGNIKFIGELFKLKMLTETIMHDCIVKLLKNHDEESLECLCRLLSTIGKDLDFEKAKSNWVPRRGDQGPKTIEQIHKEAELEEHREQVKVQQQLLKKDSRSAGGGGGGGGMGPRGGPHTPGSRGNQAPDDGWNTVPISTKNRPIDPTRLSKITKPGALDFNNQLLAPGGKGTWGSWGKGSSGGSGAKPSDSAQDSGRTSTLNRFSALQQPSSSSSSSSSANIDSDRRVPHRSSSSRERSDRFERMDRNRPAVSKRSFSREKEERSRDREQRPAEMLRRVSSMTDERERERERSSRDNGTPNPGQRSRV